MNFKSLDDLRHTSELIKQSNIWNLSWKYILICVLVALQIFYLSQISNWVSFPMKIYSDLDEYKKKKNQNRKSVLQICVSISLAHSSIRL